MQQVAAEITSIPWGHIILLISKVNGNTSKASFYIRKTIEQKYNEKELKNKKSERVSLTPIVFIYCYSLLLSIFEAL